MFMGVRRLYFYGKTSRYLGPNFFAQQCCNEFVCEALAAQRLNVYWNFAKRGKGCGG